MSFDSLWGTVYKKTTGTYFVRTNEDETVICSISSKLRKRLIMPTADRSSVPHQKVIEVEDVKVVDPVAVGDRVVYIDAGAGEGMITEILPRTNQLTRSAPGTKPLEQVIVANVDQVVAVMAAAQPKPKWNLLDRYLAAAEEANIPALICVTKTDLVDEEAFYEQVATYAALGYPVILSSAQTGAGIDAVREALTNRISVLIGMSGVGKSTMLNAVQPELGVRVNEVNTRIEKGRHTTTHLEMFPLAFGGSLIDTPGMKLFGLWNLAAEEVALLFREMKPYVGTCKFGLSCTHDHEPGCTIRAAVERGEIDERRYDSYRYMIDHMNTYGE